MRKLTIAAAAAFAALGLATAAFAQGPTEKVRKINLYTWPQAALPQSYQASQLIAQQWRWRLRDKIVMAANTGYRPGWVHFAVRSGADRDLVAFLAEHRPPGADEMYGSGHRQATGGALRPADWNAFIAGLGFGPAAAVPDAPVPDAPASEAAA